MTARLILGREIGEQIRAELRKELQGLKERGITPGLGVVLVGDDPGSQVYVNNKASACRELGIFEETFRMPEGTGEGELLSLVDRLDADGRFHGILVQLPLPEQIDERRVLVRVNPAKDVDCFHPANVGRLASGNPLFLPATPAGIQQLLVRTGNDPSGKHVVICGRSNIVGKPLASMLVQKAPGANATVTVCHTGTRNLGEFSRQADILVAAMGRPRGLTAGMVKEGAVVIDVGMNRIVDASSPRGTRLVGDVDFEAVKEKASAITPVPGGVGPMTVTMLMANVVKAAGMSLE